MIGMGLLQAEPDVVVTANNAPLSTQAAIIAVTQNDDQIDALLKSLIMVLSDYGVREFVDQALLNAQTLNSTNPNALAQNNIDTLNALILQCQQNGFGALVDEAIQYAPQIQDATTPDELVSSWA